MRYNQVNSVTVIAGDLKFNILSFRDLNSFSLIMLLIFVRVSSSCSDQHGWHQKNLTPLLSARVIISAFRSDCRVCSARSRSHSSKPWNSSKDRTQSLLSAPHHCFANNTILWEFTSCSEHTPGKTMQQEFQGKCIKSSIFDGKRCETFPHCTAHCVPLQSIHRITNQYQSLNELLCLFFISIRFYSSP